MNKHMPRTASAVLTLCAAVAIIACRAGSPSSASNATAIPTAKVIAAQRGNISEVLTLAGQFQPFQVVDVHPKVSGYMSHINVDIGDMVRQGQTLAVLEVPELTAQLQGSAYDVEQSREETARAQHEIDRTEALYMALHAASERLKQADVAHPGLIAQQELDDAQAKDLAAQAQVESARAALAAAQQHGNVARSNNQGVQAMEDYTHVTAPLSGVVVWRYADTGALIQGGTSSNSQTLPIVRLAQIDILRFRIAVSEDDVR
jgi:multidrug efflux pump subunit AcrA (membrane-fusion protein)